MSNTNTTNGVIVERLLDRIETTNQCYGVRPEMTVREALAVIGMVGVEVSEKTVRHLIARDQVDYSKREDGSIRLPISSVVGICERQIARGKVTDDSWLPFLDDERAKAAKQRNREMTAYCHDWAVRPFADVITELLVETDDRKRRILAGIAMAQREAELRVARGEA